MYKLEIYFKRKYNMDEFDEMLYVDMKQGVENGIIKTIKWKVKNCGGKRK